MARWLIGVSTKTPVSEANWVVANGNIALLLYVDGELDAIGTLYVANGRITEVYLVRNPDKLTGVGTVREVSTGSTTGG